MIKICALGSLDEDTILVLIHQNLINRINKKASSFKIKED